MIRSAAAALAPLVLIAAGPACAMDSAAGHWAIAGHALGADFTLDCRFAQSGSGLTGACVDGETHDARVKGGRSHPLTKGVVNGDRIEFGYQTSFMFSKFEVVYSGVLHGDEMSGVMTAPAAKAPFTGKRLAP
jgi:hypothetical protein